MKGLRCGFGVALASSAFRRVFVAARRKRVPDAEDKTMFRLTCIELNNGEFAVYINNHYLGSEDASSERLCLGEIREQLSQLPGVELQTLHEAVPEEDDWCWNDIADRVLPPVSACRDDVTVAGLMARLKQYPPDALCLGTFWLADDFLSLDDSLSEEKIAEAMRICDRSHDAGIGFNWDTLQIAIDGVKGR
ncbi:MAG: hypothetical protein ACLTYF_31545 [Escherichia sp.]|uniref:hypothetical protein n=1 Tax=Enterobacter cloacae complex TaxID=354276 RepID=UPI0004BC2597|nr:hypothetical protein [Enterobacter ludwigii]MDU2942183.1 hypothetical protein [Enterobacteriaceae bacterium]MDU3877149.1 hypothetical protein [Klebsiella aerogenes]MDU5179020.1 hypothetical protein [Veillonella sp.]